MQQIADSLTPIHADAVVPFEIEGRDAVGRITRLDAVVDRILTRHAYPLPVARLLGQALALTALLGSIMKFEGIFTLQIKGDGPVSLLVCDFATPSGSDTSAAIGGMIRGMASFDADVLPDEDDPASAALLGEGYMALTIDQGSHTERYQGIVDLSGDSLDDCARHYFATSEQLPSEVASFCDRVDTDDGPRWRAGSLLVQHLPPGDSAAPDPESDDWAHVTSLMRTLTQTEALDRELSLQHLLYRLFHEDGVRVFAPAHLGLDCRCNRQKLEDVIRTFPKDDVNHMVVDGRITVTCQFCTTEYVFDPANLGPSSGAPEPR